MDANIHILTFVISSIKGKTFVVDYEGYAFVFLSKYKQDCFIKMWYILWFYFLTTEHSF